MDRVCGADHLTRLRNVSYTPAVSRTTAKHCLDHCRSRGICPGGIPERGQRRGRSMLAGNTLEWSHYRAQISQDSHRHLHPRRPPCWTFPRCYLGFTLAGPVSLVRHPLSVSNCRLHRSVPPQLPIGSLALCPKLCLGPVHVPLDFDAEFHQQYEKQDRRQHDRGGVP